MEIKQRGGRRPGAGRKPGTFAQKEMSKMQRAEMVTRVVESVLPRAFKGDAHAFLCTVYKNEDFPLPVRLQAAVAAIPFEKPRLAAVQHTGDDGNPVTLRNTIEVVIVDPAKSGSAPRLPAIIEASPL